MRRLISLGIGFTLTAAVACSGVGTSPENIDATVQAAVIATQRAQPTLTPVPSPSPTAVPEYQPQILDFVISLSPEFVPESYEWSQITGNFELLSMLYEIESILDNEPKTQQHYSEWISNVRPGEWRGLGFDVLESLQRAVKDEDPPDDAMALVYPRNEADSLIVCTIARTIRRFTISPLVSGFFTERDNECQWDYGYFLASGEWDEGYVTFMSGQIGMSLGGD